MKPKSLSMKLQEISEILSSNTTINEEELKYLLKIVNLRSWKDNQDFLNYRSAVMFIKNLL